MRKSNGLAATTGAAKLYSRGAAIGGVWVHLDADVLNDDIMPAVEYRLADGLQWDELSAVLKVLMASGQAVGTNVGIFNPRFDADGSIGRGLASSLIAGLRQE
jgi:arginase